MTFFRLSKRHAWHIAGKAPEGYVAVAHCGREFERAAPGFMIATKLSTAAALCVDCKATVPFVPMVVA